MRKQILISICILLCLFKVTTSFASTLAYIANKSDDTISVIDTSDNSILTTITVGDQPRAVAVGIGGYFVYVTNRADDTVSVINTNTNKVIDTIPVGDYPYGVVVSSDGNNVYVINFGDDNVSVISTSSNTVTATIDVGAYPHGIAISNDGKFVYVTNRNDNSVSVIDTSDNSVAATVNVGVNPLGVAVTPNDSFVYVTNWDDGTVSVIDTSDNSVIKTINLGDNTYFPEGVVITPNGDYAYVAIGGLGKNLVTVIDTSDNSIETTVSVGGVSTGISITPDGNFVHVVNKLDGTVSVIDTSDNSVSATTNVGKRPESIGSFIGNIDTILPEVSTCKPADKVTDISIDSSIFVTFSEEIAPATITTSAFTVKNGSDSISGTLSYSDKTATFTPLSSLSYDTTYTVTISTSVTDLAGNNLSDDKVWTFITAAEPQTENTSSDTSTPVVLTQTSKTDIADAISKAGLNVNSTVAQIVSELDQTIIDALKLDELDTSLGESIKIIENDEIYMTLVSAVTINTTLPIKLTLKTDDSQNSDVKISATFDEGTSIKDSDGNDYNGDIQPPKNIEITDEIKTALNTLIETTADSETISNTVVFSLGNAEMTLNLQDEKTVYIEVTVTLLTSLGQPKIYYFDNVTKKLTLAGVKGTNNSQAIETGGTILSKTVSAANTVYVFGLLLDHMSTYVASSATQPVAATDSTSSTASSSAAPVSAGGDSGGGGCFINSLILE